MAVVFCVQGICKQLSKGIFQRIIQVVFVLFPLVCSIKSYNWKIQKCTLNLIDRVAQVSCRQSGLETGVIASIKIQRISLGLRVDICIFIRTYFQVYNVLFIYKHNIYKHDERQQI